MQTFQLWVIAPVDGSIASTVFWPLIGTYSVDPSAEYTDLPGRAFAPPTVGSATFVGVPSVPSLLTGKRVRWVAWDSQRNFPSGEYVGPSWPTVPSDSFWLTPDAEPTVQM